MKYFWFLLVLFFHWNTSVFSQQETDYTAYNCYTIAVSKGASKQGTVLLGHNEDDWGDLIVNLYKVLPKTHSSEEKIVLLNGTEIPQVKHTYGYLWWETTNQKFGDYYLNEKGVSICSNACLSREDTATGNIGYYLRRIIAERAASAKDGVKIAGEIISSIGYESYGRTYVIADANEIWIMAVVKGRHWIAKRVPENQVAIVPNYYTIETVDLRDTVNVLASDDIILYAILRGWYFPQSDGAFNFKQVYGKTANTYSFANVPRHWSGINALANTKYAINKNLPFSFYPKRPVTKKDVQLVLESHYEGTDFETNYLLHKNPHENNLVNRICNAGTKFSIVTQLNDNIPCIVWWAPLNPCIHPYIPVVFDIQDIPKPYHVHPLSQAMTNHFNEKNNTFEANPTSAYAIFKKYNDAINEDYEAKISQAKHRKQLFEEKAIKAIDNGLKKDMDAVGKISASFLKMLLDEEKKALYE